MSKGSNKAVLFDYIKNSHGSFKVTFIDNNDEPVDITNWSLRTTIRSNPNKPVTKNNGVEVLTTPKVCDGSENGIAFVDLSEVSEDKLCPGIHKIDVFRNINDNWVEVVCGYISVI